MKKFLLLLLSVNSLAAQKFYCPSDKSLRFPKPEGIECFEVDDSNFDAEIMSVAEVAGQNVLIIDATKQAEVTAARQAAAQAKAQREAECATVLAGIDSARTFPELIAIIKCLK